MAIFENDSRTVLGCTRKDRDYLHHELDEITALLVELHNLTLGQTVLPPDTIEALKRMSIRLSQG